MDGEPAATEVTRSLRRRRAWVRARSGGPNRRRGLIERGDRPTHPADGPGADASAATPGPSRSSLAVHRLGEANSHAWAGLGTAAATAA